MSAPEPPLRPGACVLFNDQAKRHGHLLGTSPHFTALLATPPPSPRPGTRTHIHVNVWSTTYLPTSSPRWACPRRRTRPHGEAASGREHITTCTAIMTSAFARAFSVATHLASDNRRAGRRMCRSCSPRYARSSRFCNRTRPLPTSSQIPGAVHRP